MSSQLALFLAFLAVHWFADFALQTHWMASNKSKDNRALAQHVAVYMAMISLAAAVMFPTAGWGLVEFIVVNAILHFTTDYVTSRWSATLFAKNWHDFFVAIGFDQLIHQVTLACTMVIFLF